MENPMYEFQYHEFSKDLKTSKRIVNQGVRGVPCILIAQASNENIGADLFRSLVLMCELGQSIDYANVFANGRINVFVRQSGWPVGVFVVSPLIPMPTKSKKAKGV